MFNQAKVESVIKVKFKNSDLIKTAFTHRSYLNEHRRSKLEHNERLEFLGDAVLELVVTDFLYNKYPDEPEGVLTSWRSALVKTESLAELAETLDVGQYLLMSRGEVKSGGRERVALLANLMEAVIGAIYLDNGYDAARDFIAAHITVKLVDIIKQGSYIDAKSHFQELAQEQKGVTPSYDVLEESGPDHDKHFEVGAYLGKKLYGKGTGSSKQAAQQSAAESALKQLQKK